MNWPRLIGCFLASLPAGWFAGVLYRRLPKKGEPLHLFRPFPRPIFSGMFFTIHVLVTALFLLAAIRFADDTVLVLATYLVFFTSMIALSAIDLDTLRLPDHIVGGTLVVGLPMVVIASLAHDAAPMIRYAVLGAAVYFGFLLITHLAFPRGMGFGDVKLAAVMGLYVGWAAPTGLTAITLVLYAMLAGFLVGSAVGIALFAFRGKSRHYPFGPFLVAGAIAVILLSQQLLPEVVI